MAANADILPSLVGKLRLSPSARSGVALSPKGLRGRLARKTVIPIENTGMDSQPPRKDFAAWAVKQTWLIAAL